MSEACLQNPADILEHCFGPATALLAESLQTPSTSPSYGSVFHQCATFAESQYLAILKSPDVVRRKVYVARKKDEISQRRTAISRAQQSGNVQEYARLNRDQTQANALFEQDKALFEEHNTSRNAYLKQAIEMYSKCLEVTGTHDDDGAISLCSLWFANFEERDQELQHTIRAAVDRVPSRKFVFLAHQLSARLSGPSSLDLPSRQVILHSVVSRMCREHPFHSLYQVFALRPHSVTKDNSAASSRRHSERHDPSPSQNDRALAATDILDQLRNDPVVGDRISAVERVYNAAIQWAKLPIKNTKIIEKRPFEIPANLMIRQLSDVRVPVTTIDIPIDLTLKYDDCVWISKYNVDFSTAGGANLPKICVCIGSDGKRYKQLVSHIDIYSYTDLLEQ